MKWYRLDALINSSIVRVFSTHRIFDVHDFVVDVPSRVSSWAPATVQFLLRCLNGPGTLQFYVAILQLAWVGSVAFGSRRIVLSKMMTIAV